MLELWYYDDLFTFFPWIYFVAKGENYLISDDQKWYNIYADWLKAEFNGEGNLLKYL